MIMDKSVRIFKSTDDLSLFFAHKLAEGIRITKENSFFSLALSGGTTPGKVFSFLSLNFSESIEWRKVRVFWGDERCVAPESNDSNFRMAKENLLDHIPIPANQIFRIRGEAEPEIESERYTEVVKHFATSERLIPRFDLMMLGLGDDGHTASIFPVNTGLFNSDKLFEVTEHPQTKQKRITATGKLINQARDIVFLVTGENKAEMVSRIIERKPGWEQLPASLVKPVDGDLIWLLDEQAALKLLK